MIDRHLSNPIPSWAEHGSELGAVTYEVATGMDDPNPDSGEEYQHTNTQLFNVLDEVNRFKDAMEMVAPFNAPAPGQAPSMDASSPTTSASSLARWVASPPTRSTARS